MRKLNTKVLCIFAAHRREVNSSCGVASCALARHSPSARSVSHWLSSRDTRSDRPTWERSRCDSCADHWVGGVFEQNHAYQGATHFFFNMCNSISLMSSLGKLMPRCRWTRCFYVNCNVVREPSRPWCYAPCDFPFSFLLAISRAVACSYVEV